MVAPYKPHRFFYKVDFVAKEQAAAAVLHHQYEYQ